MKRLLIVDDEEAILLAFSKVLSEPSLDVDTASTAEEAFTLLGSRSYAAVLADLRLAGATVMEGFDVVAQARKTQPQSKIIVITAYADNEARQKMFDLGADLCLEKPISPHRVKEILESMHLY